MPVLRARWSPLLLSLLLVACHNDPKEPEYWVKQLNASNRAQDKVRVLDDLRESHNLTPAFLPMLHEQLAAQKHPEAKGAIARVLGSLKDPSSVEPLIQAVDTGSSGSATDRMNREIAAALGQLNDSRAVKTLLTLLNSRDPFLQLQAAESLGQLKAKSAVGALLHIAQDEGKEALVANHAIDALGAIGDPTIVPDLVQLMFAQRGPVSLYDSSAFALYRMGKPAADALLPVLSGKDDKLQSWAHRHDVAPAALYSKAAQVLGWLMDARAEPALLGRLAFKAADENQQGFVRLTAADALGRLRSAAAVKPMGTAAVTEDEVVIRAAYLRALGRIGQKDSAAELITAAGKGIWEQRGPALDALALVGDSKEAAALETLKGTEADKLKAECADPVDPSACRDQAATNTKRAALYQERIAELKTPDRCAERLDCWAGLLDDTNPGIRTRAALVLGRSGQVAQVAPLLKKMADDDREARLAILQAVDWLTQSPAGVTAARAAIPDMEKQYEADKQRSDWVETTDNLKRLIAKLKRTE